MLTTDSVIDLNSVRCISELGLVFGKYKDSNKYLCKKISNKGKAPVYALVDRCILIDLINTMVYKNVLESLTERYMDDSSVFNRLANTKVHDELSEIKFDLSKDFIYSEECLCNGHTKALQITNIPELIGLGHI